MMIGGGISNSENPGLEYNEIQINRSLVSTYSEIVKSKGIAEIVIDDLNLDMDYKEFSNKVSITQVNDTQIISVKVVDTIPERAMDIANETSLIFKKSISKIFDLDNVQIIDKADLPKYQSYPNVFKNSILGVFVGFFISVVASVIKQLRDTTFKDADDFNKAFNLPVLGMIPNKEKGE